MTSSWKNPEFKYTPAAETAKSGYLKRRFDQIRRELREAEASKVVPQVTQLKKREAK